MKRSDIRTDQVLWYTNSTKFADSDHYSFGDGVPVVVLSEDRYYLRPRDSYYYGGRDNGPRLDPHGKGVLVAELKSRWGGQGDLEVTVKVVNPTHLRGDWWAIDAEISASRAAKRARDTAHREQRVAYRDSVSGPVYDLQSLGLTSADTVNAETYRGRVTLSAEDAALVVQLLRQAVIV